MFQIGEFSKITKVSLRMLRYYDINGIFIPKIKDEWTGYRYYTADQIEDLYKIIQLRDAGFGVGEIAEWLQTSEKDQLMEKLTEKRREIEQQIKEANAKLNQLELLCKEMNRTEEMDSPHITIVMKSIPTKEVYSLRRTMPDYFAEGDLWAEMMEILKPFGYDDKNECFSLYHDEDDREENVDIETCVVVKNKENRVIPKGLVHRQIEGCESAASIMIYGPYENISKAYQQFAFWLESNPQYYMDGPTRQICHVSYCHTSDVQQFVTELLIPLSIKQ